MNVIDVRRHRVAAYSQCVRIIVERAGRRASTADFGAKTGDCVCWWIFGVALAYFVVRGAVSLLWGV